MRNRAVVSAAVFSFLAAAGYAAWLRFEAARMERAAWAAVEAHPETEGMGCTATALLFDGRRMGLIHVGDSRAYLLRDGTLSQITKDDTFVQTLVEEGRITPEQAHTHPQRSLIMRAA